MERTAETRCCPRGKQGADHRFGSVVDVADQIIGHGDAERAQHDDEFVEQGALVAIGEHHALVDGAGQRHREKSRRRAGNHCDGLTGVAENELRLGVVLALLVELFDARHLASGFGSLDAVSQQHDPVVDAKQERLEQGQHQP